MNKINSTEMAHRFSVEAFTFLAHKEELIKRFLNQSGLKLEDLQNMIQDSTIFIGVLDFYLNDESVMQEFCNSYNYPMHFFMDAHRKLNEP